MKTIFINDDCEAAEQFVSLFKSNFPEHEAKAFEDIYEANREGRVDIAVFDISAVCPMMLDPRQAYSPICSFFCNHPGCEIVICSGVGEDGAQDIIDKVKQDQSDCQICYGGWGRWDELKVVLDSKINL